MKKILAVLLILFALPLGVAVMIAAAATPAIGEELRTISCAGQIPPTGDWRPPFQQAYVKTSGFGERYHPVYHKWVLHDGVDLVSQPGPGPVVAIAAGRVLFAGPTTDGWGNAVDVEHAGGIVSRYAHLSSVSVSTGQVLPIGQKVGVEGATGASTGTHLHLRIHINGKPVDPVDFMEQHGAPLTGAAVAPSVTTDPTTNPAAPPPSLPAGVAEGGIGFPLPGPGTPRQNSMTAPALPIPEDIKRLYVAAANTYKLPWTLLAGIGMEETGHGRNNATSSAGAQGLMQFMPATWATMGLDGDGDGRADIHNDADSIFSAANYLTKSGVASGPTGVTTAILAYNHATWYVNDVLFYARAYGGGTVLGDPTDCGTTGEGDPALPPLTNDRLQTVLTWAGQQTGDAYVMGANGPNAWDCSSLVQNAYAQVKITMPRTAGAQRDWLAKGNGSRVQPGQERPGDLIFWDSYLGPARIGHVVMVWDPASKSTIEARSTRDGVGHFSYEGEQGRAHIFEIWRVGNMSDQPTTTS
ncbi:MAG: peptidoglycan DD-metalloendopeptidase family protein [Terracoccus sp.]